MARAHTKRRIGQVGLLCASLLVAACARIDDLPELRRRDLRLALKPQTSSIFDGNGRLITTLHGEKNRTVVGLRRMPRYLRRAVVAIEDERFFQHGGVDVQAILRAAVENVTSGQVKQGGSTITQQYVKSVIISPDGPAARTLDRKINEAVLSRQLEQRLSKREILERYLNTVYFGKGAYGVQAAAKTFFGEPVGRLKLSEAAMLAGVIRSPGDNDPYVNPGRARRRRALVLDKMVQLGWLGERQMRRAARRPLGLRRPVGRPTYPAPYFVDYVKRLLTYDPSFSMLGRSVAQRSRRLFEGGLKIHTTVDMRAQHAAERAVSGILPYPNDPHGALVAIDPRSGYVKAMVGGRDFFASDRSDRFAKLNLAITSEPGLGRIDGGDRVERRAPGTGRQAGSAFKPFALVAAIKQGVPLTKRFSAQPCMTFPGVNNGQDWRVCNYEEAAYGRIPLLQATTSSVNVVYAQLILGIGPASVATTARSMGIRTPLAPVPSAALGANPVNPLGMASAYGTLAAGGVRVPPTAVKKIVDTTSGKVIYRATPRKRRVLDPAVAYLATDALQDVITSGTGTAANIGRPAAGKTGTAQEYRDAWFVGYTPQLVAAVWVGYPRASIEMKTSCLSPDPLVCRSTRITVSGGSWPAQIWQGFMSSAMADLPVASFPSPDGGLVEAVIDERQGCLANRYTPDQYRVSALFIEGTDPDRFCPIPIIPEPPQDDPKPSEEENGDGPRGDKPRSGERSRGPGGEGPPGQNKQDDDD